MQSFSLWSLSNLNKASQNNQTTFKPSKPINFLKTNIYLYPYLMYLSVMNIFMLPLSTMNDIFTNIVVVSHHATRTITHSFDNLIYFYFWLKIHGNIPLCHGNLSYKRQVNESKYETVSWCKLSSTLSWRARVRSTLSWSRILLPYTQVPGRDVFPVKTLVLAHLIYFGWLEILFELPLTAFL